MTTYLPLIVFLLLVFVFIYIDHKSCKRRITQYLQYKGATNISISKVWLDFDRDTSTYDVSYTNAQGNQRYTGCKIRRSLFFDGDIYWRDRTE